MAIRWFVPAREREQLGAPVSRQAGFSLVELMVVIAIIGLLSTIVAVNVLRARGSASEQAVRSSLQAIEDAAIMFHNEQGVPPRSVDELAPYVRGGRESLQDPWGNDFIFEYVGGDNPYRIGSYGADGQPGGEGENAEIFLHDHGY